MQALLLKLKIIHNDFRLKNSQNHRFCAVFLWRFYLLNRLLAIVSMNDTQLGYTFNYLLKENLGPWHSLIDQFRILVIGLELACNEGSCGGIP